jgi:ribonuclease Z
MKFWFLGTSASVPSAARDTTSLLFENGERATLVDCGGAIVARLGAIGIDPLQVDDIIITHVHSDHVYGLPLFLDNLALLGRRTPLTIRCHPEHTGFVNDLIALFGGSGLPFRVETAALALTASMPARIGGLSLTAAPSDHGRMACAAVRLDGSRGAVVYSSDTRPAESVVELARGAHTLVHEATFPHTDRGRWGVHSTAREAGEVAAQAGVRRLLLTHVGHPYHDDVAMLEKEARKTFGRRVEVARELAAYLV